MTRFIDTCIVFLGLVAITCMISACKTVESIPEDNSNTPALDKTPQNSSRHGLEVLRWTTSTDSIEDALLQIGEEPPFEPTVRARLEQDGFVIRMLDFDQISSLLIAIGGSTTDVNIWHGQIFKWRLLHESSTPPGGAMLIDGRAAMMESGNCLLYTSDAADE